MIKKVIFGSALALLMTTSAWANDFVGNAKVSLLGTFYGEYKLSESVAEVPEEVTVGLDYGSWSIGSFDISNFGVRGYWYKEGALEGGAYAAGMVNFVSFDYTVSSSSLSKTVGTGDMTILGAIAGYQWFFDQFNINAGAGYGFGTSGSFDTTTTTTFFGTTTTSTTQTDLPDVGGFTFDLNFGYAF